MLLSGKTAFIAGAGGLGSATASMFCKHGAYVVLADVDVARAERTVLTLKDKGYKASAKALNITDPDACNAEALSISSSIDAVINAVGVCPRGGIKSDDFSENWRLGLNVNLDGVINLVRAFHNHLAASHGSIINIASIAGFVSTGTSATYSASKGGVIALTKSLAHELASDNIRVNAIAPGPIETEMIDATRSNPERRAQFLERIPMKRFGQPDEVAGCALFLASELSSYMTGSVLTVDGGYLAA